MLSSSPSPSAIVSPEELAERSCLSVVSAVSTQLQTFRIYELQINELHFKSNVPRDIHPTTIAELLIEDAPVNKKCLDYEKWHQCTLIRLEALSKTAKTQKVVAQTLFGLSTFYSKIRARIMVSLWRCRTPAAPLTDRYDVAIPTLIEEEVRTSLMRYDFPTDLDFDCRCDSLSHVSQCSKSVWTYLDLGLDPGKLNNRSTVEQLHWVDSVLSDLATTSELLSPRLEEMIAGLKEHKSNIIAHITTQRFRSAHPDVLIRTVMKSKTAFHCYSLILTLCTIDVYKPVLLFQPPVVLTAIIVLSLSFLCHLPRETILGFLTLLQSAPAYGLCKLAIPRDPRSYEKVINIKVEEDRQVVCPQCGTSYSVQLGCMPSQTKCLARAIVGSHPCGRELFRRRGTRLVPILLFRRRRLGDWLQELLARPGMIHRLDQAWKQARHSPSDTVSDFWGGSFARTMKGPDSVMPFSSVPQNESRLLLSLSVDWFNPFHNKAAGQVASTGVMFITCLNLPPSERYKDENIYLVGILPGSKHAAYLDGVLEPLVKDLLQYWTPGVYFSGLPGMDHVRLIRCALIQIICDLPAARKIAGFPGHNATCHCSVCFALRRDVADLSTAHDITIRRNLEDHMMHARHYKAKLEAEGRRAAEALLKSNPQAVRWSPLNELPYWNPIQSTVIDPMHLILLGLCQFHWRRFWGGDRIPDVSKIILGEGTGIQEDATYLDNVDFPLGEGAYLDNEQLNSAKGDHDVTNDMQPRHSKELLTAKLMNKARALWIMKPSSKFMGLSNSQLLCLLQENGAVVPTTFSKKAELVQILEVFIELFSLKNLYLPANH
jgi:hypothetical protein